MESIKNMLSEREKYLQKLKKEKEKALKSAPEGALRICSHGNRVQYYHRTDPKDFNGVYIREDKLKLVHKLAQKDYDQKVLKAVEKELNAIRRYYDNYPAKCPELIYENMHPERQKLIVPIYEVEEEYVRNWESVEYEGKDFSFGMPEYYTAKGERVRSKSEVIIADALNREDVPYRYEYPQYLSGMGTVYPDFTVLNVKNRKELYWEHLGMMDDPVYAEKAIQKIGCYQQDEIFPGENLILTYEAQKYPLNQRVVQQMIERYLK